MSITDRARSNSSLMSMRIDGARFGDVLEEQSRFRIEGSGPLSRRTIVPETRGARSLVEGTTGAAFEQAIRGYLATFDSRSDDVVLDGIALSTSQVGYGANILLGIASESPAFATGLSTPPTSAQELAELEQVSSTVMKTNLDALDGPDSLSGVSMRYLSLSPIVSANLIELATTGRVRADDEHGRSSDEYGGKFRAHTVVATAVHELAHRITPPEFLDLVERARLEATSEGRQQLATGAFFSEASAELVTHMPDVLSGVHRRLGTVEPPRAGISPAGYVGEVDAITRLLALAGLDPVRPIDSGRILDVLEGGPLRTTPSRLADAIALHQNLDAARRAEVESRLERIAPVDDEAHDDSFDARTHALVNWMGAIAKSPQDATRRPPQDNLAT